MSDKTFQCPVCNLHYSAKKTAIECEKFCSKYNACSMEITKNSLEHQQFIKKQMGSKT